MPEVVSSPPAQISPVRDPNYDNFNYGQLLNQAGEPLRELGQGRLALAQQQGQRTFDLMAKQKASDLAGQREQQRLQTEASLTEMARQRLRNENAATVFAQAKTANPDFKPDPSASLEENVASAQAATGQATLKNYKNVVQKRQQAESDYMDMFNKMAQQQPVDEGLIARKLAQDPDLTLKLTAAQKTSLASGTVSPSELINGLAGNGRLVAGLEGAATGVNPRDLATTLAQKYQDIKTGQQQIQQQVQGLRTTAAGRLLESNRDALLNEEQVLRAQIPGFTPGLSDAFISAQTPGGSNLPPSAATGPGGTHPLSAFGITAPTTAPAGAPPAPSDPTTPPIVVPPGTPQAQDPNFYSSQIELNAHRNAAQTADSEIQSAMTQKQNLLNSLQPGATTAEFGNGMPGSENGGDFGSLQRPYTNKEKLEFSKNLLAVNKQIEGLQKTKQTHIDAISALTPATVPPQTPPANINLQQPPVAAQAPQSPPAPSGTPAGPQQPGQIDQAQLAARNRMFSVIGTSDPQALQKLGQFATTRLGMSQQDISQLLVAATNGNPTATARVKQIVSQASQQPDQSSQPAPAAQDGSMGSLPPTANGGADASNLPQ